MPHHGEARIACALAVREAVARHGNRRLAVRRAVVRPLRASARERHVARRDRPFLLNRAGVVARAGDAHHVVARVRGRVAGERVGDVVEVAVRLHERHLGDRSRLQRAVVHRVAREADVPVRRIVAYDARLYLHPAVRHEVGHDEVCIAIHEVRRREPHRRRAHVGSCHRNIVKHNDAR